MHRLSAAVGFVLAIAGCGHSAPFAVPDNGSDQPFADGSPRRLTFNVGDDRAPAWLPDESGFLYSLQRRDRRDLDRCLGLLPPDGGRLLRTICDEDPAAQDSTNELTDPAADGAGRLAYVVTGSRLADPVPGYTAIVLGSLSDPIPAAVLRTFPYFAPDTVRHDRASHVAWLRPTSLVYLAEHVGYTPHAVDTVRTGAAIVRLELGGAVPALTVVPGTRDASSVAVGESADVIYFTLGGDSRVFRRVLSTGAVAVAHDFGAAGIARDVQLAGSRLVAVVGGNVSFAFDPTFGNNVQLDGGGVLHLVDLTSGADSSLPTGPRPERPLRFRRPALAPSGTRLVAEAVDSVADLWMFDLP